MMRITIRFCLALLLGGPALLAVGPEVFAPGVISVPETHDDYVTFTPDGSRVFFTRLTDDYRAGTIYTAVQRDGQWSTPVVAWFSGRFNDSRPFVSPDGTRLFFASERPRADAADQNAPRGDLDLWVVDLTRPEAPAVNLGAPVNTDMNETHPSVAANGDLYFPVWGPGLINDIFVARWNGTAYAAPERLGPEINTPRPDSHPFIDPQQRFLLLARIPNRDVGDDIFVALRGDDGRWQPAVALPAPVNGALYEYTAKVDPSGEWLYFSRTDFGPQGRKADIYRVRLREIELLARFAR